MSLATVLTHEDFAGLTDAECVSALDETTEISRDETYYKWPGINRKLLDAGMEAAGVATWNEAIKDLTGGAMMHLMLTSDGVNFALPEVRGIIQAAIASTENAVALEALGICLNVGIQEGKRYIKHGLQSLPTEDEVTAARVIIQNETDTAALMNECIYPLIAEKASLSAIKSAVAAWGE